MQSTTPFAFKPILDQSLKHVVTTRGSVSNMYEILSRATINPFISTQQAWEQDLDIQLPAEQWETTWRKSIALSRCTRYRVIQFKIMCRAYITPSRLSKMSREVSDRCWHNCGGPGTLIHLLWSCPSIKQFWSNVVGVLTDMMDVQIPLCPTFCLLGIKHENVKSNVVHKLVHLGFLSAKRIILMNWRTQKPSCFAIQAWLKDYLDLLSMERATNLFLDFERDTQGYWDMARAFIDSNHQYITNSNV